MGAKHHHMHHKMKKARGGGVGGEPTVSKSGKTAKTHEHEPQKDLPELKEASEKDESFKDGGHARGKKGHHRLDKKARGGAAHKHRASGGRVGHSPFTEAHSLKGPSSGGSGQGHEKDGPSGRELSD